MIRFHATIDEEDTRTFVDDKIRLRWTAEDLISLFEGTTRNKKYKFMGETGDNAGEFDNVTTGFGSGNDVDRYYAMYPYVSNTKLHEDGYITYTFPTVQTYAENSFGQGANPMVAVTANLDDYDLCFRNAAGYLRLYLYGEDVTIRSVTVESNNSEPLAGSAIITPEYGGFPSTEMTDTATTTVTLDCEDGVEIGATAETSTPFWIVLPPTLFTEGFTITFTDVFGNKFVKTFSSQISIERNKYVSARLEFEVTEQASIANNEIRYISTDGNIVTPRDVDAYGNTINIIDTFGANIISNTYENGIGIITFDGDVTKIGDCAFYSRFSLKSITIPASVTSSIGESAFNACISLKSVTFPEGLTGIKQGAFRFCSSLKNITIPSSVTSIGSGAFDDCSSLESITISEGVKDIGMYAFSGCPLVTSITIPESIIFIGRGAFLGNSSLESVTVLADFSLPGRWIGDYAFSGCSSLSAFYGDLASSDNRCLIVNRELRAFAPANLTEYTIPNNVTSIGAWVFDVCSSLESVTIPEGVTDIGWGAFNGCSSLEKITIPSSVTSIDNNVFAGCSSLSAFYGDLASNDNRCLIIGGELKAFAPIGLTEYTIPNGVTSIGNKVFADCSSLTSITIPESVTDIGWYTFRGCSSLTSIIIPNGVTSIGIEVFADCSSLTSITIPSSVTSIEQAAFGDCSSLENITIPESVTSIGLAAFSGCSSLTTVYCRPTTPPTLNKLPFDGNAPDRIIYVPTSSVDVYKSVWNGYALSIMPYDFN